MLDSMFSSILSSVSSAAADVSAAGFFACCAASLILGAAVAGIYMFRHAYSKNFVVTLALLPVIVQMVIMLVNGNIGEISRDDKVRVVRDSTVIFEGKISSLRRFKDDVKTVKQGYECGIGVDGYQDIKVGDVIEGFRIEEVERTE